MRHPGAVYLFARATLEHPRVTERLSTAIIFDATIHAAANIDIMCSLRCPTGNRVDQIYEGTYDIYAKVSDRSDSDR
jgi:hypothetical protein